MTTNSPKSADSPTGFSLVELLVAIAVIAILASIGITSLGGLSSEAKETAAKKNAQNVGAMSASLSGLGVAHVIPESLGGVEATCRLLEKGVIVPDGPMQDSYFGVAGLSEDDIPSISVYLAVSYQQLHVLTLAYDVNATSAPGKKKK